MAAASWIFFFCLVVIGAGALRLPDYITKCAKNDPNFNDCALKSGREAFARIVTGDDRALDLPVLDPLFVEKIVITHAGLKATSNNFTIVGVKDTILDDFSINFDKQIIRLSFRTPLLTLSGQYDVSGKIMGLPMYGNGDYTVSYKGLRANYTTNYTLEQLQDGEQYMILKAYDVECDVQGMKVDFHNLFNGNKLLGDSLIKVINENWRLVVQDFGKPMFMALGGIIHQILGAVSQKVPYNELFAK